MTVKIPVDRIRACRTAGALVGLAVALGACTHTEEAVTVAGYSNDYRQRHPIAIQEADRSIVIFVGHARGGLSRGIIVRRYHPEDPRQMAAIRLNYPKISAVAGPCGLWPEDIGPSIKNPSYSENKSYYNFGCAYQRNMAAMVDNPADLVQPRPETPTYTTQRTTAFEKYRKGAPTTVVYSDPDKAKLSDTAK